MKSRFIALITLTFTMSFRSVLGTVGIPAEDTWPSPIYTVNVAEGKTIDLQSATVSKWNGSTTEEQTGIDAGTTSGTIVKTGPGELTMTVERANFAGQVHIKEGVVRVNCKNPLGGLSATNYVYTGATLIADYSNPESSIDNTSIASTVFFAGGTGAPGQNGQYVMIPKSTPTSNIRAPFAKAIILGGNTTWNLLGSICFDSKKKIDLQGHELTFNQSGAPEGNTYSLAIDNVYCSNPGGFVFDHLYAVNIRKVAEGSFPGNGSFTYRGTPLTFKESLSAVYPMDWKLVVEDENELRICMDNSKSFTGTIPNTNCLSFGGLELPAKTDLVLRSKLTDSAPVAFMGPVTGGGGIVSYRQIDACKNWLVTLGSPDNTFLGGVSLWENCRLDLLGGGNVLPAAGGDVKLANGGVLGLAGADYTLPGAQFDGTVAVSNTIDSATGEWTKPVVKTGEGVLDYTVGIGGPLLDVREGTVRFAGENNFASVAGLNKGRKWFADNGYTTGSGKKPYKGFDEPAMDGATANGGYYRYTNGVEEVKEGAGYWVTKECDWDNKVKVDDVFETATCFTNGVVRSVDIAYDASNYNKHPRYCLYTYTGYIWNDTSAPVTRTLAITLNDRYIVRLNGIELIKRQEKKASELPERTLLDLPLNPGPNALEIRLQNRWVSSPGYYACATNGFVDATLDFGMGIAEGQTTSTTVADYARFEDAGDGRLFTTEKSPAAPPFEKVRLAEGTTLDLNGGTRSNYVTAAFDQVEGAGSIIGGNVVIADALQVVTNATGAAATLSVNGKVTFAAGAKIAMAEGMTLSRRDEYTTILSATAIEGTPVLDDSLVRKWKLDVEDNKVKLRKRQFGLIVTVK